MLIRFQSPTPGKRGVHTGVFGLTNTLGHRGLLTPREHAVWRSGNDWYEAAYPDPSDVDPTIYDAAVNPRATAWFKDTATHLIERVAPYLEILEAHGVECVRVDAADPGRVIYEDHVQVVVVPHDPAAPTSYHPAESSTDRPGTS